ncbi:uncharacterized protein LOC110975662 [Acanthaster planci]|uniref:Uncharacterized protein LOC110975662 n=1 Tax=Acanthaster planci TaxID=133434 RepID=A0A8B7XVZ1_ACAPL|nr:uncharacterized protein LOC110975662 [Acanthaster planci]
MHCLYLLAQLGLHTIKHRKHSGSLFSLHVRSYNIHFSSRWSVRKVNMAETKLRCGVCVWSLLMVSVICVSANEVDDVINDAVGLGVGVIIAIVVGCVLVLVSCILCCYYCCCRSPPPAHHTVVVSQTAPPAQPTVVVAQAPAYNPQPQPGPPAVPMQQPVMSHGQPDHRGPPPYPGQQSSFGYVKL